VKLRIETRAQVWKYTAIVSAISIAAPVFVVGTIMSLIPGMPILAILFGVSIAFFIPLLIAPPLAYLMLTLLRMQHETIKRVDDHTRFDLLTGVLNRNHFLDNIRSRAASGVLMIVDADHFKQVNDRLGHAAGDEALGILAKTMHNVVGNKGIVGRLGGEEFGVFMPGLDAESGSDMCGRLCKSVRGVDMIVDGKPLKMTISIGGTVHHQHLTIGHSLKIADKRLYSAKNAGRDRFLMADAELAFGAIRTA
jgi:diguanylate cyclase